MMLISLLVTSCLIATSILSTTTESANVYCKSDYECVGQAISNSGSGTIYVYGYKSASGSSTSITVSGSQERLYVQSEFGAYQLGTFTSNYYAYLNGGNAMTSAYLNSFGVSGYAACSLYDAYIQSTGGYIYCYSDMTCDSATINYAFNIQAQGSYALHSATINTDGKSLTLSLYGYYAGYNAILNCDSGDTCTINCYGNACYGLQLNCVGTCTTSCDDSTNTICPIDYGTTVPSIPNDEADYQFDIATQSITNMENCELSGATTYGDYNSAASGDISTSDGNICCQAQGSCSSVGNIEITGNDHDIICGGQSSCYATTIYTASSESSNVYCTGRYGCQYASIKTSTSGMVHCGSIQSCTSAAIYSAKQVYCSGYSQACYSAAFYAVSNIYLTGYYAAQNAIIYSNGVGTMYVHFAAYLSGDSVTVYCDYDDYCYIYCKTNGACTNAAIYGCGNYEIECNADSGIACPTEYEDCPTSAPTDKPSASPTQEPTMPTYSPTSPTLAPTFPTNAPTSSNPTMAPSNKPSEAPTSEPSEQPTFSMEEEPTTTTTTTSNDDDDDDNDNSGNNNSGNGSNTSDDQGENESSNSNSDTMVVVLGFEVKDDPISYMVIGIVGTTLFFCCLFCVFYTIWKRRNSKQQDMQDKTNHLRSDTNDLTPRATKIHTGVDSESNDYLDNLPDLQNNNNNNNNNIELASSVNDNNRDSNISNMSLPLRPATNENVKNMMNTLMQQENGETAEGGGGGAAYDDNNGNNNMNMLAGGEGDSNPNASPAYLLNNNVNNYNTPGNGNGNNNNGLPKVNGIAALPGSEHITAGGIVNSDNIDINEDSDDSNGDNNNGINNNNVIPLTTGQGYNVEKQMSSGDGNEGVARSATQFLNEDSASDENELYRKTSQGVQQ